MSSLTVALAALGGVVLAAVVAHGAWQARKAGPKRAAIHPGAPRAEPIEPVLGNTTARDAAELPPGGTEPRPAKRPSPRLDALIDPIAPLTVEAPVSGEVVLMHMPTTRRAGSKLFFIEGLNAETGEWEPAAAGQRYGELQAGVQLANRPGALNEIEYPEFLQKGQAFAET